jgi:hypothetical protein
MQETWPPALSRAGQNPVNFGSTFAVSSGRKANSRDFISCVPLPSFTSQFVTFSYENYGYFDET